MTARAHYAEGRKAGIHKRCKMMRGDDQSGDVGPPSALKVSGGIRIRMRDLSAEPLLLLRGKLA